MQTTQAIHVNGKLSIAWLLGLAIILKPFYIFPSGMPQPSDVLLLLTAVVLLTTQRPLFVPYRHTALTVLCMLLYAIAVNIAWALIESDIDILQHSLFYAFNIFSFFTVLALTRDKDALRIITICVFLGMALQLLIFAVVGGKQYGGDESRQIIYFNNPNQLGYWALLSASLFAVLVQRIKVSRWVFMIFMGMAFVAALLSLSKAAIISIAALGILMNMKKPIVLIGLILGLGGLLLLVDIELFQRVLTRLGSIGSQSDDSFAGRAYDRIWTFPEYLLLGAGEGGLGRFGVGRVFEIHSTLGTLLFSYGIIGFGLFVFAIWQVFWRKAWFSVVFLSPVMLYGLTHNGLRVTLFWMLLALIIAIAPKNKRTLSLATLRTNVVIEKNRI